MRVALFRTDPPRLVAALVWSRLTGRVATFPGAPLVVREVPDPPLERPGWVRVRTRLGAVCGSDLHMLRVEVSRRSGVVATRTASLGTPVYPGHEAVGVVEEVGPAVRRVEPGQRVALVPGVFCSALEAEPCRFCAEGLYSLCRRRQEKPPGFVGAGWSEGFVRHESQVFPVPDGIDDETACLFEPASCSVHAVLRRPPAPGSRVLVVGAGMIGLTIVRALRALGRPLDVTVVVRHPFQSELATGSGGDRAVGAGGVDPYDALARATGTTVVGRGSSNRYLVDGFDVVYDAVGSASSLHDSIRWCRPRGYVTLVGVNLFPGVLDRTPLWRREIDVVGAVGHGDDEWEGRRCTTFLRLADWLLAGRIRLDGLVTHRFPAARYREALAAAGAKRGSRAVRVALEFGDAGADGPGRRR